MKYPESLLSEDELIIFDVHHHPVVLFGRGFLLLFFLLLWVGLISSVSFFRETWTVIACLIFLAALALVLLARIAAWSRVNFVLTNERLIYRSGFLHRESRETPLSKVSDISTSQLIFDRILGYGDLIIELVSRERFPLFHMPRPEELKKQILKQVNLSAADSGEAARGVLAQEVAREINKIQPTKELELIPPEREPFYSEIVNQLERLANLNREGVITEEEFLKAKASLLEKLGEGQ
ncbi:MAG: PH domain-containing protein [Actinobacteria bacterium]|nr:PH domain-containing protein [Actinomycetota bacterium]